MKSIVSSLSTHLQQEVTNLASCLRVERTDGELFHFTTHDQPLDIDLNDLTGTRTYSPSNSYRPTSMFFNDRLDVDEMELQGIMDSSEIDEDEVRLGLFDYAEVKIFLTNWNDSNYPILKELKGTWGEVEIRSTGIFVVEVRGLSQPLRQGIVRTYRKDCNADLGDARCGLPMFPNEVLRDTSYSVDDYVRVSNVSSFGEIALPITNPGFETGDTTGWTVNVGTVSVITTTPKTGTYSVRGDNEAAFELEQVVDVSTVLNTTKIDNGDYRFSFEMYVRDIGQRPDDSRILVEYLSAADAVLGTAYDTGTESLGSTVWGQRHALLVALPTSTRKVRIKMTATRVTGTNLYVSYDAAYGTFIDVTDDARRFIRAPVVNPSWEYVNLTGWTTVSGDATPATDPFSGALLPRDGLLFVYGHLGGDYVLQQDVDLTPAASAAKIDVGDYQADITVWQGSGDTPPGTDQGRVTMWFLDASDQVVRKIRDTGIIVVPADGGFQDESTWYQRGVLDYSIPVGARKLRIEVEGVSGSVGYDDVEVILTDMTVAAVSSDFDDRIYKCVTAGTTEAIQPTYDTVVGNQTTDGTAVFEAEEAWSRAVEVIAVDVTSPRRIFTVTELTPNTGGARGGFPDDWMNYGGFTFESGNNAGRTMEIKDFTADDGSSVLEQVIELVVDLPFDVVVGDKGRAYPGCDKLRQRCRGKFANYVTIGDPASGLRHRGFPDLPGEGFLNRTPDFKPATTTVE